MQAFSHIANVSFTLQTDDGQYTEHDVQSYWPLCMNKLSLSPMFLYLKDQLPHISGVRLTVTVKKMSLRKRLLRKKLGKTDWRSLRVIWISAFSAGYNCAAEPGRNAALYGAKKEQEDREKVQKAIEDMAKREDEAGAGAPPSDEPLVIGYLIRGEEEIVSIREIQDEEKRKTIQGYVFDVETKELRSGRTLLTLKITDYTDSLIVKKMFSRDKEDVPLVQAIKKRNVAKGTRFCTKRHICPRSCYDCKRY
ncbi:hypothetical protein GCM10020331_048270 [Ectobacillus funiculus]